MDALAKPLFLCYFHIPINEYNNKSILQFLKTLHLDSYQFLKIKRTSYLHLSPYFRTVSSLNEFINAASAKKINLYASQNEQFMTTIQHWIDQTERSPARDYYGIKSFKNKTRSNEFSQV